MGKPIITQKRGKGSMTYRAHSFRYKGKSLHRNYDKETITGVITDFVHCRGHSAPLMEIEYQNGEKCLMVAPEGLRVGDEISAGIEANPENGNCLTLERIPEGTLVCNIESVPGDGGKFVRGSGTFARVIAKTPGTITVILPSKKRKNFNPKCRAAIGVISGGGRTEKPFVKAGSRYHAMRARNKLYPQVSGVSMNALSHPFGGTSSHHKGRPTVAPRFAPAGRNVGKISPRRTGRRKK